VLVAGDMVLGSEREKRKKKKEKRMCLDGLNIYFPKTVVLVAGDVRRKRTKNIEKRTHSQMFDMYTQKMWCLLLATRYSDLWGKRKKGKRNITNIPKTYLKLRNA